MRAGGLAAFRRADPANPVQGSCKLKAVGGFRRLWGCSPGRGQAARGCIDSTCRRGGSCLVLYLQTGPSKESSGVTLSIREPVSSLSPELLGRGQSSLWPPRLDHSYSTLSLFSQPNTPRRQEGAPLPTLQTAAGGTGEGRARSLKVFRPLTPTEVQGDSAPTDLGDCGLR